MILGEISLHAATRGCLAKENEQIQLLFTSFTFVYFLLIFFSLLQLKSIIELCNFSRETCLTGDFPKFPPHLQIFLDLLFYFVKCCIVALSTPPPGPQGLPGPPGMLICISFHYV